MKVLFVCSGGMSSAIAIKALQTEAAANGIDMDVLAVGAAEFQDQIKEGYDIAMIAPQIKHKSKGFMELGAEAGVPVINIVPQGYSPLGGKILLKQVKETLGL